MIKLYVAILNHGWIRQEYVDRVLPQLFNTKDVKITLEELHRTYDHPISSNRNRITQRFLATDNDFLLMIDNDVIPLSNPAEMVFADKDIIGFPAKVRQNFSALNWTAYMENPKALSRGDSVVPVDLDGVDDLVELLEVDAVGTGCILIKRKVLESLKAPFHCIYDQDGILIYGTDFAFCKKAKREGFKVYSAPQRYCEHIKEIGLLQTLGFLDVGRREVDAGKYALPWGNFAIDQTDWFFIKDIIRENGVKSVLEFGSGLSSLFMSEKAKVISYEMDEEWKDKVESLKTEQNDLEIRIWDGINFKDSIDKVDLIFIDGPKGKCNGGVGRETAFQTAVDCSDRIVVHDAGRPEEIELQNKYLKGKFRLISQSGYFQTSCTFWKRRKLKGDKNED